MRITIILLVMVLAGCGADPEAPTGPQNLVILSIDTLRADHLGLYGYARDTSPNLNQFARTSVTFDQAITVNANTAPSHATILTGRFPGSHGIERNGMTLLPGVPTLAQVLGDQGWATGGFVSGWTLQRHTELDRGFSIYDDRLGEEREWVGTRRAGRDTTEAALDWLEQQADDHQRFFLFLHLFEPHWPYEPPLEDTLRFLPGRTELTTASKPLNLARLIELNRLSEAEQEEFVARYDAEIVVADRLLGRLLAAIDDLGVRHNTVVVVLSDHGETLFDREWMMDHGTRPYEEQIRVPLVVHVPGDRSAGRRVAAQVSLLDVLPTIFDIFDLAAPDGLQGRSLLGLARGESTESQPRPAFITAYTKPARVPHIDVPLAKGAIARAARLPGLKFIEYPTVEQDWYPELYDLVEDPGERNNLVEARPETASFFHDSLNGWQTDSGANPFTDAPVLDPEVAAGLRELGYLED